MPLKGFADEIEKQKEEIKGLAYKAGGLQGKVGSLRDRVGVLEEAEECRKVIYQKRETQDRLAQGAIPFLLCEAYTNYISRHK